MSKRVANSRSNTKARNRAHLRAVPRSTGSGGVVVPTDVPNWRRYENRKQSFFSKMVRSVKNFFTRKQ